MTFNRLLLLAVLALLTLGGSLAHAVSITAAGEFDTRCFAAFKKQSLPDINVNEDETAINYDLRDYFALGDVNVTGSPVCGDVAPTHAISLGSLPAGVTLTQTDKNDAHISGTPTTAGAVSFTYSGDNSVDVAVTDAVGGTISAVGGTATVITEGVGQGNYFVCPDGNDSNNGQTHATRWKTLPKVNGFAMPVGSDVWLCAGATFTLQNIAVDWSGTGPNRVVIGSYYVSGGVAYQNRPSDTNANPMDGLTYTVARPIIRGSYQASCRVWPNKCNWNTANQSGDHTGPSPSQPNPAFPASTYGALVSVIKPYVTVQDLELRDSAGIGAFFDGYSNFGQYQCFGINRTNCDYYWTIQNVKVSHTANNPIILSHGRYVVVYGNETEYDALIWRDAQPNQFFGSAINVNHCDYCRALIENNWVHDGYGEGIGVYVGAHQLIRGNRVHNHATAEIYLDGDKDMVIEQNIIAGGEPTLEPGLGNPTRTRAASTALAIQQETSATSGGQVPLSGRRHLYRNNMVANVSACMTSGIDTEAIQNSTARLSGKHLGNTCVHPAGDVGIGWYGTGYNGLDVTDPRMPGLDYANNLVAASTCIWQSPGALALEHHNYLTGTPTPAGGYACSLPGIANATDEVGTLAAVQFTPTNPLEEATGATFPAWDDFAIPATSSAATGATSTGMSTAILVEAEWTWVLGQRRWLPCSAVAQVPAADWIKALATDYCQDTRDGTSFGALNHEP